MKILIVSTFDQQGGAAKAAYRLHNSLLKNGVDSKILVQSKSSDDYSVIGPSSKLEKLINSFRPYLDNIPTSFYKNHTTTLFSTSWLPFSNTVKKINEINPDIVHLHWINFGMVRIEDLANIKAPIIWTLHDMWAFTGGCHYDEECGAYEMQCGNCKVLGSLKTNDLSRKIFLRKLKVYSQIPNMTIIALSSWLAHCAKESSLFKNKKVLNLPNPIDTNIFKPSNREISRELWNLPKNKTLILFGALSSTSDPRKGFSELSKSLLRLKDQTIEIVIFGSNEPNETQPFSFKTHYLGHIHDDVSLVTLYNACDILILPSLQENLSNVIMECLACGTPAVAFDLGGNSDMIEHKQNGYLAKPFDSKDLANGIEWVLKNNLHNELSNNAREKVLAEFDSTIVSNKYIELYNEILKTS